MLQGLLQQISGVVNLSIPLILIYHFSPDFLLSYLGIILCSLAIGAYVASVAYFKSKNEMKSLTFAPSPDQTALFNKSIIACGLDPKTVDLRYAYAGDGIAITLFNTIVIDPMLWKDIDDPEFYKTREIIEKHVLPAVDEHKKKLHAQIDTILTSGVQEFVFKHELGHIVRQFSIRRIVMLGCIAALATSAALWAIWRTIAALGGFKAFFVGFIVGTCTDLLLSYASNVFFKAQEEKKADLFACTFSSREQIEKAADFFEQYEGYAQKYRDALSGIHTMVPSMILSGYIDGKSRARYLRDIAQDKA
jgi:hypothetical protein